MQTATTTHEQDELVPEGARIVAYIDHNGRARYGWHDGDGNACDGFEHYTEALDECRAAYCLGPVTGQRHLDNGQPESVITGTAE